MSAIPGSLFATSLSSNWATFDPTGTFLYVVNSGSDNITGYRINPADGSLTPVPGSPFETGLQPNNAVAVVINH